jgi:LPS-assembly protein
MTPDCASLHLRLARAIARLAAIALGLSLSCATPAQDSNPGDCIANEKNAAEHCAPKEEPVAAVPFFALDWVPLEYVPEALRDRQCINCGGRYMDPLAQENTSMSPKNADIHAHANSTRLQEKEVILTGDAQAVQGYRQMRSDNVVIDRDAESAFLSGNVTLREPNVLLLGDSAQVNSKTGEAIVYDNEFVFHREHMRGTADILQRDPEGLIHIHNGNFTYCAPGEDDWSVLSKDMEVDLQEGLATAHHARVELKGVPVFYTPWLRLPLDDRRRTGLLWPNFGTDSSGGLDISVPVYFNLAPNYDALYAPRYIQDRGLDQQLELRYLNPLVGQWLVGGAYMDDDRSYRDQTPEQSSTDRWLGVVKQDGLFAERWLSRVDYNRVSDVDYMKDLKTTNIDAQRSTSLLQLASLDYLGDKWLMSLRAQQFQSLADDIKKQYEELPQFTNQYRSSGTPFAVEPIILAQYSNFGAEEDVVTGQRLYGEAGLDYPMLWRFGSLKPTLKYRQVSYQLNDGRFFADNSLGGGQYFTDSSPSAGAPLANLDGSLIFERETSFAGKGLLQTLEPRLYYLYSEHEDQANQPVFDTAALTFTYYQLFRETRFSGHDRLDDANQVSAGLTSRFIDDETGRNLVSASVGQIYYFQDREVRLTQGESPNQDPGSEIAGILDFSPTEKLGLGTSLVWDPYANNLNSGFYQASYKTDYGSIFNLGYAYRRPLAYATVNTQPLTEEASISSYLPLDDNWSVFGAMNYSVEDNISVSDMVGVEYDSCCWMVRLLNLRYYSNVNGVTPDFNNPNLEHQQALQFQFVLKGMGGFGNRITNIMQTMIRGFEEREY